MDYNFIKKIHKTILGKLKPNLTFVLKVSPQSSSKRLKKEKQKIDMIILQSRFTIKLKKPL